MDIEQLDQEFEILAKSFKEFRDSNKLDSVDVLIQNKEKIFEYYNDFILLQDKLDYFLQYEEFDSHIFKMLSIYSSRVKSFTNISQTYVNKINNQENLKSIKLARKSIILGYLSIFFGFLSIIYGLWSSRNIPTVETINTSSTTIINSIKTDLNQHKKAMDPLLLEYQKSKMEFEKINSNLNNIKLDINKVKGQIRDLEKKQSIKP